MASLNKAQLIGNLGADPKVSHTKGGQPVATLSVATSEKWTDKEGQIQERTEWHRVVVWGKLAENCGKYLAKGRPVYVEGRMTTREFTDDKGNKRWTTELVAQQVQFLGTPPKAGDAPPLTDADAPPDGWGSRSGNDEDIPF